jgi:hypothetical protein
MNDDRDLDRELRTHLDLEAEEQREARLSAEQARDAALKLLGNQADVKEDVRLLSPLAAFEDLLQDVRHGLRMLLRDPIYTIVAAGTLALGIAANTAMFSVVDAVLLQPLPYPRADRLAMVWEDVNLPTYKNHHNASAPGNFHDWNTQDVHPESARCLSRCPRARPASSSKVFLRRLLARYRSLTIVR